MALAAPAGEGQHVGAGVDGHDGAGRPALLDQLSGVEAGPATDVEDPFPGDGGQRFPHVAAAADHVPLVVRLLQCLGGGGVEGELGHDRRL